MAQATGQTLRIDIVSDVMCPWCFVGYHQLRLAQEQTGIPIEVFWHPFELNPQMAPEGEELREHLMGKYGITVEQSVEARARLEAIGDELNAPIRFTDGKRIYNTFALHRLLYWAAESGQAGALKLALFEAYFTDSKEMNDPQAMADVAAALGVDRARALEILTGDDYAEEVRAKQQFWTFKGISGVPAMVFERQHLVTGAQGVENYASILTQLAAAQAGAV